MVKVGNSDLERPVIRQIYVLSLRNFPVTERVFNVGKYFRVIFVTEKILRLQTLLSTEIGSKLLCVQWFLISGFSSCSCSHSTSNLLLILWVFEKQFGFGAEVD